MGDSAPSGWGRRSPRAWRIAASTTWTPRSAGCTGPSRRRPTARPWRPRWCRGRRTSNWPSATCWRNEGSAMAVEIKVPRLGWNMEQGTFMGWLKRDGDAVQAGEPLFTLEGDKAVEDIEAMDSGILRRLANGPKEGEVVAVGAVLGYLTAPGENVESVPTSAGVPEPAAAVAAAEPITDPVSARSRRLAISPRARKAAANLGVDWTQLVGSGRQGRIRERDVLARASKPAAS